MAPKNSKKSTGSSNPVKRETRSSSRKSNPIVIEEEKPLKQSKSVNKKKENKPKSKPKSKAGLENTKEVKAKETEKEEEAKPEEPKPIKKIIESETEEEEQIAFAGAEKISDIVVKDSSIEKALEELSKWNKRINEKKEKSSLFSESDDEIKLYLQATGTKFFSKKANLKARTLALAHPIYDLNELKVCIFVKDDLIDEETLKLIESKEIKNLSQIITGAELKKSYKTFETRRKLLSEYDLFLCDDNLITVAPKLLGKIFFDSPKFPLTFRTCIDGKFSLEKFINQFEKSINSVGFRLPMGTNATFKLGTLGQDFNNLKDNLKIIISYLERFPIRALHLKLKNSPSLPIYLAKKLHTENDILDEPKEDIEKSKKTKNDKLSQFDKGLLELGLDEDKAKELVTKKNDVSKKRKAEISLKSNKKPKKD